MNYILIDTSSYENENFNFNNGYLKIIESLCERGDLKLLTHKIIDHEIKSHILERVANFKSSINNLKYESNIFYKQASYEILKAFNEEWFSENELLSYNTFCKTAKPITLENKSEDLDAIVDDYINKQPPFGSGNKKHEFPDSIILKALSSFEITPDEDSLYIISSDSDWIKYAKKYSITAFESIYSFMSNVMSEDEQNLIYTDAVEKWIEKPKNKTTIETLLTQKLSEYIQNLHYYDYDDLDDSSGINEIYNIECIYFNKSKKELSFQVDIDCQIKYLLSYNDFDNATYDREDGVYYNLEYVRKQFDDSTCGVAVISLKYELGNNNHIYIKDISDIEVFQLNEDDFHYTLLEPEYNDYDYL